jgi:hypothetical protein
MTPTKLLRALFKRSPLYRTPVYFHLGVVYRWREDREALERWEAAGSPAPPPHVVKQQALRRASLSYGLRTLVETGTYLGEMVFALRNDFGRIYSIEIEPMLCANAAQRLRRYAHVSVHQGDSSLVLPRILSELSAPALFWLDGHYSEGATGRGEIDTPIRAELATILRAPHRHVLMIDDAHCFTGTGDYPSVAEVEKLARTLRPDASVSVDANIIQIA